MSFFIFEGQEYVSHCTSELLSDLLVRKLDEREMYEYDLLDGQVTLESIIRLTEDEKNLILVHSFYILGYDENGDKNLGQLEISVGREMTREESRELLNLVSSQRPQIRGFVDLHRMLQEMHNKQLGFDFYCPGFIYIC